MATSGFVDATNVKVMVGNNKIAKITSGTFGFSADERDRRNNDGSGWMERGYGTQSSTLSGDAFFEFDAGFGYLDLLDIFINKTVVELVWNAGEFGDTQLRGQFILNQLDKSGGTGEDLKYNYTFNSTSPVVAELVPAVITVLNNLNADITYDSTLVVEAEEEISFAYNSSVEFECVPDAGYEFNHWTITNPDGTTSQVATAVATVVADKDFQIEASVSLI